VTPRNSNLSHYFSRRKSKFACWSVARGELSMINENLCRNERLAAERATQTARRKVIYEELHPETKHGANLHGGLDKLSTPVLRTRRRL
jgi:hypothetical protein